MVSNLGYSHPQPQARMPSEPRPDAGLHKPLSEAAHYPQPLTLYSLFLSRLAELLTDLIPETAVTISLEADQSILLSKNLQTLRRAMLGPDRITVTPLYSALRTPVA